MKCNIVLIIFVAIILYIEQNDATEDTEMRHHVESRANHAGTIYWWLDGTSASKNGKWIWQYNNSPITFNDWYQGKPVIDLPNYCLMYWEVEGWKWSDAPCTDLFYYICQAQP
ncbi:hypothetical protein CHUAL_002656 [Chamberlinius hualienensis]